jgi:hypothetical protein
MASIICRVSAQFTQNVFLRLDEHQRGYLDQNTLEWALVGLGKAEVRQLMATLDQDGDQRISPYELNLAILDWLSESHTMPMPTAFTSLLVLYGLEEGEPNQKKVSGARPHTTSDHLRAQIGYAR